MVFGFFSLALCSLLKTKLKFQFCAFSHFFTPFEMLYYETLVSWSGEKFFPKNCKFKTCSFLI